MKGFLLIAIFINILGGNHCVFLCSYIYFSLIDEST